MEISAAQVKELRERTGAGMMDCKKALMQTGGDMDKAITVLREKGLAAAEKKAGRAAAEGLVHSYIHMGGKVGVLVEVNCETDFVAKTDDFKELAHEVALQIAALKPQWVRQEDVPEDVIAKEREVLRNRALGDPKNQNKPAAILDRIIEGQLSKFFAEHCLLEQPWVKDDKLTIGQLIKEKVAKIGENISVRRFTTYVLGEGLEKRQDDFADEVGKLMQ